ncbi:MAG: WD-40 repeat protein, partial [uncultured bacterium (gcode 4)]
MTIEGRDPVAFFDFKSANAETPNTILFDATKSYDPDNLDASNLSFAWIIDGDRVNLSSPARGGSIGKFTFNTVGTHHVTLEVTNKEGKMISYNKDITIDSLLSVKLITSPKISTIGSPVTLIADAREAQAFEWQFGDGENDISTSGRITHVYKKSGTFDVSLTIRGKGAQSTNTISRKVYVMSSNSPFAIITLKRDNEEIIPTSGACDGQEAFVIDRSKAMTMSAENSVNNDGTNAGLSYTWKYGSKNSSQREFSYKFDELGCFPITLTVRSQKTSKTSTMTSYVKIENLPPRLSSLGISPDKIESDPVTVTVTANNAADDDGAIVSYIWYYYTEDDPEPQDFRITRSPKTVFVLPRVTGKYFFAVILEDSNGTKVNSEDITSERFSISLTSDSINTPIISLKTSSTSISTGQKVDFNVTVKNILGSDIATKAEYKWDYNGDGFYEETTNVPKASHTYDMPGSFNAKVKVTYKGVSNTKYQTIVVKNEITPNLEYVAIGKKFVFFNTTRGLYTSAKWRIGDVTSTNPASFVYDAEKEGTMPTDVKLEVSDGTLSKSITTSLKKDTINALRLKRNEDKLVYFSYPLADNDTIRVSDPADRVFIYLGESRGQITKYVIDTNARVDSDLNGETGDDADNRGTDSAANGSPFAIKNMDSSIKERLVKLSLYDANNKVIATKDIKIIYEFADDISADTLSGALDTVPKDISEIDKANMEKLKDLIRNTKEQDRLKMMQYLALLQENWFDTREKTKIIIDFETYIDSTSPIDAKMKEEFYSILEGFLMSDNQVKDDITLATKVLKSLIPKTNPSYTQIMKNIDEILSHPTNITLNKELGTFILDAIKNDSTINNQDKLTIKSQLEVIINGGQNNVPQKDVVEAEGSSSILGFIIGFLKLFGYLLLLILAIFLGGFVYFRMFNKDENIGFQDFLIEKLFNRKQEDFNADIITSFTPEPNKPIIDPLQTLSTPPETEEEPTTASESFTSSELISESESITEPESTTESESIAESMETPEISTESTEAIEPSPNLDTGIPDWLKQTTSLAGMEEESESIPESLPTPESEITPEPETVSEPEPVELVETKDLLSPEPTPEKQEEIVSDDL